MSNQFLVLDVTSVALMIKQGTFPIWKITTNKELIWSLLTTCVRASQEGGTDGCLNLANYDEGYPL